MQLGSLDSFARVKDDSTHPVIAPEETHIARIRMCRSMGLDLSSGAEACYGWAGAGSDGWAGRFLRSG